LSFHNIVVIGSVVFVGSAVVGYVVVGSAVVGSVVVESVVLGPAVVFVKVFDVISERLFNFPPVRF
jgi:hypothetical protein